jgi:hypothetical protein
MTAGVRGMKCGALACLDPLSNFDQFFYDSGIKMNKRWGSFHVRPAVKQLKKNLKISYRPNMYFLLSSSKSE